MARWCFPCLPSRILVLTHLSLGKILRLLERCHQISSMALRLSEIVAQTLVLVVLLLKSSLASGDLTLECYMIEFLV
jgi:hypothetical protein